MDCQDHTTGTYCEECEFGFIRDTIIDPETGEETKTSCTRCPCPLPTVDNSFAEQCWHMYPEEVEPSIESRTDAVLETTMELDLAALNVNYTENTSNVYCQCNDGYSGDSCDSCEPGFWGNPLVHGSSCKPCDCNGNSMTCNKDTGACDTCDNNTGGDHCENCAEWYYGDASNYCEVCMCDQCGAESCDTVTGYCTCKEHVSGEYCDECQNGYWNFPLTCDDESSGCLKCECSGFAMDDNCDKETGQCNCPPNVVGKHCDECAPDHWGLSDQGCTPCDCPGLPCNPQTGQCDCPPGISGRQCDTCESERSVIRQNGGSGELYCYECNNCVDHLLDDIFLYQKENTLVDKFKNLREMSLGTFAWRRLAKANSSYLDTKAVKEMIESRVDLVLNIGETFKNTEDNEYMTMSSEDNLNELDTLVSKEEDMPSEDYYSYDYVFFENDIKAGDLLVRGKSIRIKSGNVCKTIHEVEESSQETIEKSNAHKTSYESIYDDLHKFKSHSQTVASNLREKIDTLDDEAFHALMRAASQDLQLIRTDSDPIAALTPLSQAVFDKSSDLWKSVQEKYPIPSDAVLTELVASLEVKSGNLRDLLVYGQEIQNTVNDIGNQQDGYIQQISQTQTETSLLIIDTNTLLKDMVKVTNETANLIKSIVQHSTKMGQRGKDISTAIETLNHPKYNNFSWYENVDQSLRISANYAEFSRIRTDEPLAEPIDKIYPLYSNIIGQIGNISSIAESLTNAADDSSNALNILENAHVLEEKAEIERKRAKELHQEALKLDPLTERDNNLSEEDAITTSNTIADVTNFIVDTDREILEVDEKINKLIEAVSNERSVDLSDLVLQAENQANKAFTDVYNKAKAIGLAYNQSKEATGKLRQAVATQKQFDQDLDETGGILMDLMSDKQDSQLVQQGHIVTDTDITAEVISQLDTVEQLIAGFDLEKTIDDCSDLITGIEKELDFAIQTAKLFRYSMEFKGAGRSDEGTQEVDYVQPHLPISIRDLTDRTTISFAARLQADRTILNGNVYPSSGLLMYFGAKESQNGNDKDYMAVEFIDNHVHFKFRINGGFGHLKTKNKVLNNNQWKHIKVSRIGNFGILNITNSRGVVIEAQADKTHGTDAKFYSLGFKDFNIPTIVDMSQNRE